ncbi:hypothetical protein [Methylosinus sp. Sm6]|uniref:hypothetical protein n=1 Tax=Methylosinus sp. Sm6 TaxID=2866948 RepID=UPI001C991216|nr:hypothetical protein [Methylosinus sp. Sm6]MBY6242812.1 hypothetical protein [Methylosinus sp. Sm6]
MPPRRPFPLADNPADILLHAAALPATADLDDEPHLLEEMIRNGLAWRDALRLYPRIIAAARALRAAGLGAALACVAGEAAAWSGAAAAGDDSLSTFAPAAFAVFFGLASACAALVVATIADRIDRSGQ